MFRLGPTLVAALACGCAFDSFSGGRNEGLGPGEDSSEVSGATRPGASGTRGVADEGGGEGESTGGTPPPTSGPSLPPGEEEGGQRLDFGSPTSDSGDSSMPNDCGVASTLEFGVDDANVIPPMTIIDVNGVGLAAYSPNSDDGEIEFSVDIACPGTYYLHGFVADGWSGVHSYQDPDSYEVFWPGGGITWFYGCQTSGLDEGWHWLPVSYVQEGGDCDDTTRVEITLGEGVNVITLQNREGMTFDGYVAAIARFVVTDDPDYSPM